MKPQLLPHEFTSRPGSILVLLAVATPVAPLALLAADTNTLVFAATLYGLIIAPAVLGTAVSAYGAWRIRPQRERGWVAAILGALAIQALALAAVQLTGPHHVGRHNLWPRLVDLLVVGVVIVGASAARRRDLTGDPLRLGLLLGVIAGALRVVAATRLPYTPMSTPVLLLVGGVFVALMATACTRVIRLRTLGPRVGQGLAAMTILVGGGQLAAVYAPSGAVFATLVLVLDGLGALIMCGAGVGILQQALVEEQDALDELNAQVLTAEQQARRSRATMHEVTATLAGISSASQLMQSPAVSHQRRLMLQRMVDAELARLTRLVSPPQVHVPGPRTVDLDSVLETLTQAHEARGNPVRWSPTGLRPVAHADHLTEVLNILLDNAAKHGMIATASIEVTESQEAIEIAVSDDGPGVSSDASIFDWGARGPESSGQGIGLHIARELMERQGGYLHLRSVEGKGCTFVVGLPARKELHCDAATSAHAS